MWSADRVPQQLARMGGDVLGGDVRAACNAGVERSLCDGGGDGRGDARVEGARDDVGLVEFKVGDEGCDGAGGVSIPAGVRLFDFDSRIERLCHHFYAVNGMAERTVGIAKRDAVNTVILYAFCMLKSRMVIDLRNA